MSYYDDLAYLYSLRQFGIKMGLSNIRELCLLLDKPQDRIKTIHVGGTNGKGSTAAVISSILQKAGYRVGLYTSPHLSKFAERIRINGIPISEEKISRMVHDIRRRHGYDNIMPTFFEFTTALALLYFSEQCVDIAVMEVGMGGRLDATNIVTPLVSVITNIEYDHTEHLGTSLENIAAEKCGIIKNGIPVITAEVKEDILSVIKCSTDRAKTTMHVHGKDFRTEVVKLTPENSEFIYHGAAWKGLFLRSTLTGRHQMSNMGVALFTMELLKGMGYAVTEEQAINGVLDVSWPGRLETLSVRPRVIIDGAHNHAGTIALREFVEGTLLHEGSHGKIILIFGVLKEKDASSMLGELIPFSDSIIITRPSNERGLSLETLREIAERSGTKPLMTDTVSEALSLAGGMALPSDTIIVTGSLYIVGEARAVINNKCMSR